MKLWQIGFGLLALGSMAVLVHPAHAQNNCTTRCDIQFTVCQGAAESALDECIDRAETARAKALCAAEFTKLEDACREKEAACLGNCPS